MTIAVVHSGGVTRPRFSTGSRYFGALMDGIVDASFAHDLSVTLCPKLLGDDPSEGLSDGRFDGLIWYRCPETASERAIMEGSTLPQVLIHPSPEASCPSVGCDNRSGVELILRHLRSLGHRRVGFVIEPWHLRGEGGIRRDAFLEVAQAEGFESPEESVHLFEGGLPEALGADGETAVLAWSESTAGALLELLDAKGTRVPEDLSLAGFDSTSYCDELRPRLTAVAQPLREIGAQAVELLVRRIAGESELPRTTLLDCRLDVRESTGPPPLF